MKKLVCSVLMVTINVAVLAVPTTQSQDPNAAAKPQTVASTLTNKDVLEMIKAGLTAEVIVAKIKSTSTSFDTSPTALADLKAANVPDTVILAMVNGPATTAAAGDPPADAVVSVPDGTEVEIQLTRHR